MSIILQEDGIEFFKVELGLKPPQRGLNGVAQEVIAKLALILNNMPEGSAVAIRDISMNTLRIYLKEFHPDKKMAIQVLNKEKKYFRLFYKKKLQVIKKS